MRVVFFGTPEYALPSLRGLIDAPWCSVVAAVTQPDRPRGRSGQTVQSPVKQLAAQHGIPLLQPQRLRRDSTQQIAALNPDAGVVAASGHILPGHLLAAFPHGVLNVHASLLPRHRGASPVTAAILAGDAETGATIMQVVREVDAGPVLGAVRTAIEPLDTTATVTERAGAMGARLLLDLLPGWVAGDVQAEPQDQALVTEAPRLTKADGTLDWSRPAAELWRRVRACQPWPLAATRYGDRPLTVHEAWPLAASSDAPPGTVLPGDGEPLTDLLPGRRARAVVACGEGSLALLRIQRPGRRAMDIEQYLNGDRDLLGARLG